MIRRAALTVALIGLLVPWAAPVLADTLFAADGGGGSTSTLYILNRATGEVISTVGPIGFSVTGLAYDPGAGSLYGATGNNSVPARSLIRIDIATGAGTLIGPLNTDTPMADLTFDPSGTLYGWSGFTGTRGLYTVDVTSGAATFVGPNTGRGSFTDGNGLAFDAAGNLFGAATDFVGDVVALFSVVPATALSTSIAPLAPLPGNPDASVSALAFDSNRTLYASLQNFSGSANQFVSFLVTIDPTTGAVVNRGQSIDRLDAIVFVPGRQPAPSSSALGLAALAALLASAGIWRLTGRSRGIRNTGG